MIETGIAFLICGALVLINRWVLWYEENKYPRCYGCGEFIRPGEGSLAVWSQGPRVHSRWDRQDKPSAFPKCEIWANARKFSDAENIRLSRYQYMLNSDVQDYLTAYGKAEDPDKIAKKHREFLRVEGKLYIKEI